jgi:hypothetical protein
LFNSEGHTANYLTYNYVIDRVVTEHSEMKRWLLERGEEEDRVSVIPNGVDLQIYSPCSKLDWRTRQPRPLGDRHFVAAFVGRLSEEKAPDVFLDIAKRLADEPLIEFLVCGDGPMGPALREQAAACGLADRLHFLGFVSTREYLPCFDVVVVCSRLDGRPNALMESLAMGVPVVASHVGGIPDMMPPKQEDLLCDPSDAETFVNAIRMLAGNADRYQQAAEIARRHAEQRFSASDNGSTYARLFQEVRHKRQMLHRHLSPEAVAESLGYTLKWKPATDPSRVLRLWRAFSPARWLGHLRNAYLLWRIRHTGRQEELVKQFDIRYYTSQFPNEMQRKRWPLLHYIFVGFREGWNPTAQFDTRFYLTTHPDVRQTGLNPLLHYVLWGEEENRIPAGESGKFSGPTQEHT